MQPLLVEFVGLPGAGKTTIAQQVIEELSTSGHHCFGFSTLSSPETVEKNKGGFLDKLQTAFSFIASCILFPRITRYAFAYTLNLRPWSLSSFRRLVTLIVRLRFYRDLMKGNYDDVILDQGVIQNIWSIAVTGKSPGNNPSLAPFVKSVLDEFSPLLVMIDVDVESVVDRLNNRRTARSRFDRMDSEDARLLLTRHKEVFSQVGALAERYDKKRYLRLSGGEPIQDNANRVLSFIEQARQI